MYRVVVVENCEETVFFNRYLLRQHFCTNYFDPNSAHLFLFFSYEVTVLFYYVFDYWFSQIIVPYLIISYTFDKVKQCPSYSICCYDLYATYISISPNRLFG